jgi:replicative DNA helicase
VFLAIKSVLSSNGTPDATNIGSAVSEDGLLVVCDISRSSTTNDISNFVEKLQILAKARRVEMFAMMAPTRLQNAEDLRAELQQIDKELLKLASSSGTRAKDEGWMSEFCGEWFGANEEQMRTGESGYMKSGIPSLDRVIGGFRGGDTVVIAGRTGMGKSSFAATMIMNQIMNPC